MANTHTFSYEYSLLVLALLMLGFNGKLKGQTVIVEQDFDKTSSWEYSSDIEPFDNGWGRDGFFGTINVGSAYPLDNENFSLFILGENDLYDEGDNGTSGFVHITFQETDIGNYNRSSEMVLITFDYDIVGYNAAGDDVYYQTFYDGVGQEKKYLMDGGVDFESKKGEEKILIPGSVNTVSLILSIRNDGASGYSGFDNFRIVKVPIKSEPDNHVDGIDAYAAGFSRIELTWKYAGGDIEPDGYILIAVKENTEIQYPADGIDSIGEKEWNKGLVLVKVDKDVQEYTFAGLEGDTPYEFRIIPFTNSGSYIDYKTDGIIPVTRATTLSAPPIIINEVLADPDKDNGDANGDGVVSSSDDEFVEIVNTGPDDLDISGWIIANRMSNRHIFMYPTILKPDQSAVVFGGGYPMGDFGGAYVATASGGNLGLNNSGDDIILKTSEGSISISVDSSAGNNQSLTRRPDATEDAPFVKHNEIEDITSPFSPGTKSDGSCFGTAYAILYGEEGWRMIGSPVEDVSYGELFSTFWTQGIPHGADSPNGAASVLVYNGSGFIGIDDMLGSPTPGEGFIMYVYADDNHDGYDDYFPKLFYTNATENSGPIAPKISKNSSNNAWTLLANPFALPINFDLLTRNDLSSSVYVYDHFSASYKVWNGITGSLTNGDIVPFQGFWVQQSGDNPEVIMKESDRVGTSANRFYKEVSSPVIQLNVQHQELSDNAYISFSRSGETGMDAADAIKLSPLDFKSHISLSTAIDSVLLSINNLPANLSQTIEIPLMATIYRAVEEESQTDWNLTDGEILLTWDQIESMPAHWDISIRDRDTGDEIDLRKSDHYVYYQPPKVMKIPGQIMPGFGPEAVAFHENQRRLSLVITPRITANVEMNLPKQFELHQNYPNPFNPATTICFSLPEDSEIQVAVYDITGQRVAMLADGNFEAGEHKIIWGAKHLNSGTYIYELKTSNQRWVNKMTFLK